MISFLSSKHRVLPHNNKRPFSQMLYQQKHLAQLFEFFVKHIVSETTYKQLKHLPLTHKKKLTK